MVKRLLNFWRRDAASNDSGESLPLCRVRHVTLHPGAVLWTPGASGGSLGGGAAAALDEVGVGGTVVVGFQSSAREQVQPLGILARVEAREPFPDGVDPAGLGATHRYRLSGLSRMHLDPESCTNRKIPTIVATPAPERPEDHEAPPEALVAVLEALAALDNSWPTHWLEAFETLPGAPLGQWATTLSWRLSPEERADLFERPEAIAETLLGTLEALHLGLAPEKRRAALRAETVTRRTTVMPHRLLTVAADEHGWALFHPSDLAPALNSTTPAEVVTRAGAEVRPKTGAHEVANTICCMTPRPATVRVLLTHTGIALPPFGSIPGSEAPSRSEGPILTPADGLPVPVQRILVRHGRLFLGPGALLVSPHADRLDYLCTEQWVDVPNGLFRAAVMPIPPARREHWTRTLDGDGGQGDEANLAPLYVALLEPVELAEPTGETDDEG